MGNLSGLTALAQIGAGVSAAGNGYAQYNGALGQSKYQASVLNMNAQTTDMQAAQAGKQGEFNAAVRGLQGAQEIGKARTATAGGAVDVNTGSAAKVQEDIAAASAADQAMIKQNAALQQWGYNVEAINSRTQAKLAKSGGRFAANSNLISGGGAFARDMMGANYYASKAGWYGQPAQGAGGTDAGFKATKEAWNSKEWD